VLAAGVIAALLFFRRATSPAGTSVVINETAVPPMPTLNMAHVAHGEALYDRYCAKCHGVNLEGAPNWKQPRADGSFPPPPHDGSGHTWHHSDALLLSIVANGGDPAYNSNMPAFQDRLTPEDVAAVLEFLKSKWGKDEREFQWWVTATRE